MAELRKAHKLVASALLVASAGSYFALISPQLSKRSEALELVAERQVSIDETTAKLEPLRQRLTQITPELNRLQELSKQLPQDMKVNELFKDIQAVADSTGLGKGLLSQSYDKPQVLVPVDTGQVLTGDQSPEDVTDTGPETSPASVAEFVVTLEVGGTLGDIRAFIDGLNTLDRLHTVTTSDITPGSKEGEYAGTLRARFYLQAMDFNVLIADLEQVIMTALPKNEWPASLVERIDGENAQDQTDANTEIEPNATDE